MQTQDTTVKATRQSPVWMLDYSGELVNEPRTGKRDSSGKFLKQDIKMHVKPSFQSDANQAMAAKYGEDADMLFAGSR